MPWRRFFVVWTEAGRYAIGSRLLRLGPVAFLFSRVTGPAVLNNKVREQIYLHIQARPGAYYTSIRKDLKLAVGTLTYHLYTLERQQLVRRRREGIRLRFFPTAMGAIQTRPLAAWQFRIAELVRAQPGTTQAEIARRVGLSRQALHYHVDALRAAGILVAEPLGREVRLTVPGAAWARLGRCGICANAYETPAGLALGALRCASCGATIVARSGAAQA